MPADDVIIADNDNSNVSASETYMYPGMGVGAATGTLVAGPVGLVIGGIIGALIGGNQEVELSHDEVLQEDTVAAYTEQNTALNTTLNTGSDDITTSPSVTTGSDNNDKESAIQLAQLGPIDSVVVDDDNMQQEELMNILVSDLSLDVYFRSGSTDIEKFYPARLAAIADLVNTMEKLELHLDGYTDRRGDMQQNIALANERIEKVREQLVDAGVDESRIVSKAFGEAKMKSAAGNLEAYTFDRRVVIRFERAATSISKTMADAFSSTADEAESVEVTLIDEDNSPVIADATTRF